MAETPLGSALTRSQRTEVLRYSSIRVNLPMLEGSVGRDVGIAKREIGPKTMPNSNPIRVNSTSRPHHRAADERSVTEPGSAFLAKSAY